MEKHQHQTARTVPRVRLGATIDAVVADAKHALPLLLKAQFQPLARLVRWYGFS